MRLLVSWLRDFVDVRASPDDIAEKVGLRGFEVASVEPHGDDDAVIDVEVTANRPDCLSVMGLAREVATIYELPFNPPSTSVGATVRLAHVTVGLSDHVSVAIEDPDLCPRYAAAVADVTVGPSPSWMAARLQAAGVRSISSIVDLTNYVLIELGHPMHAFDLETLAGAEIRVRRAHPGESLTTLDGITRALEADMLVIADRDHAQAVAGVMGGAASEVSTTTRRVVFESAYFKPASIRRTGKRLNLRSEASARFERGADIEAPRLAIERVTALMRQIGAGELVGPAVDVYPTLRQPVTMTLRRARLSALLGVSVPDDSVARILRSLGLDLVGTVEGWHATVPSFRVDLTREVDLIEEVGRHYGFDKLPSTFPVVTAPAPPPDPRIARDRLVRQVLMASGLSEALTFGFIEARAAALFATAGAEGPVLIENPLSSKFDTLRPSLVPGLVAALAHNRRHGRDDVPLFELGTRFSTEGETRAVGLAWTGSVTPLHWSGTSRDVDFFDVKGAVELLCQALEAGVRFESWREPFLVAGQTASIVCAEGPLAGTRLGVIGKLQPSVADACGLPRQDAVYVAELSLDALDRARSGPPGRIEPLPRHPFVVRDLSVVVADTLPAEIFRGTIQSAARGGAAPLTAVTFFDRYQGKGVPEGSVSISVRLTFQASDRTLTDGEVQQAVEVIMAALGREYRAIQR
jgi:phenylalanyl-tRNA synthetase beta chain